MLVILSGLERDSVRKTLTCQYPRGILSPSEQAGLMVSVGNHHIRGSLVQPGQTANCSDRPAPVCDIQTDGYMTIRAYAI